MKPRIASYYENRLGRNDGNPLYVTHVFQKDFADVVDYSHLIPDPAAFHDKIGKFDLHLWIDWAEDALANGNLLPYKVMPCPRPSAYWVSDSHLGYNYRMEKAKEFDWVFVAQKGAVEQFKADGVTAPVEWLPHAVEPRVYNPAAIYAKTPELERKVTEAASLKRWDMCFVGFLTFPHRTEFLDQVFRQVPNAWYTSGRFFEEVAKVYTQARVVLNHAMKGDVNMRVFEALATRSFLLTPDVPGLLDLFQDGVHLVTYRDGDVADCVEKIHYYAKHDDERERIAQKGYEEVLAKHTFWHRVQRILDSTGVMNGR